jgi:hypothetical protein
MSRGFVLVKNYRTLFKSSLRSSHGLVMIPVHAMLGDEILLYIMVKFGQNKLLTERCVMFWSTPWVVR